MPGPRKNLTPLDMQMLGLSYNQGGVINFLGQQPEVTAPVRAQSHADSPPVQLAYITDAEKDLLVDANIHGSMDGKPNPGPAGLESLDDFFNLPGGGVGGGNVDRGEKSRDRSSYGIGAGQAVGGGQGGQGGQIFTQTGGPPNDQSQGGWTQDTAATAAAIEQANLQKQILEEKALVEAAKEKAIQDAKVKEENKKRGILSTLGHGEVLEDYIGDEAWLEKYDTGQHKLRKQLDRLTAKYGEDFLKTEQAKILMNYLSGVAVERGGGLGARDETYGGGPTENIDPELEKQRQELLAQISGMGTPFGGQDIGTILADVERMGIGKDLTPEQYFNFRQQLMAADPTPGNQAYKDAFSWSSGSGLGSLAERFIPGVTAAKTFLGGLLPEQSEWADWAMNERPFYDTSTPDTGNMGEFMRREPSSWNTNVGEQPVEDEEEDEENTTDVVNLTPTSSPTYGKGVASLDWSKFGPQFGPQYPGHYSNQGIQPNFANWYDNLNKYYGYSYG